MSSSQKFSETNINIGRKPELITTQQTTGLVGQQFTTGLAASQQTTALISNEPKSVVSQEQRIAANMPITTEKHVTQEYVPVIHEEIVTTIPVVTGQAVHTGQAIAGQTFVQQLGSEIIRQEALTKVDLIPEVQTQLGAQHVINIATQSQPQFIGKATVLTTEQLRQQTTTGVQQQFQTGCQTGCQTGGFTQQTGFVTQQLPGQQVFTQQTTPIIQSQPLSTPLSSLPGAPTQTTASNLSKKF
jgi:hypothetical protein